MPRRDSAESAGAFLSLVATTLAGKAGTESTASLSHCMRSWIMMVTMTMVTAIAAIPSRMETMIRAIIDDRIRRANNLAPAAMAGASLMGSILWSAGAIG
jgi:hypothetical protein